ncbi:MAG: asparagine synthase (glutamine-hydrolyzing) [Planctomycetota bacterium]
MCGIVGEVTAQGDASALTDAGAEAWLDRLAHRGPDGRGLWREENVLLGHTRLAVRDPESAAAAQPIATPCGRYVLAYNGELYDDAALRAELLPEVQRRTGGRGFVTTCDAETLLWALVLRGASALDDLRGMYALAFVDLARRELLLARDPLGVKPLVWAVAGRGLAFASEPLALVSHPRVDRRPDADMVSAYLATSRRTLAGRTMFEGVEALLPGDVLRVDLCERDPRPVRVARAEAAPLTGSFTGPTDADACRRVIEDATLRHLVSDVPLCALLSGGLDSTILATIVTGQRPDLATWCASGVEDGDEVGPDPRAARAVATRLGTRHTDVSIDRATFAREWEAHVAHLGQPLSTPNEIAIAETARAMRSGGATVTLSGEGADELFGGYDAALQAFAAHASLPEPPIGASRFHLEVTSWVSPADQERLLVVGARRSEFVVGTFDAAYRRGLERANGDPLGAHLEVQREINLNALLERLDAATMRYGIEGRTPFADVEVARFARAVPMERKFVSGRGVDGSKIVLRDAFRSAVPDAITKREKASFPLPFERWSASMAGILDGSRFLAEIVRPAAIRAAVDDPIEQWRLAWLLGNLALWGDAVFEGRAAASSAA